MQEQAVKDLREALKFSPENIPLRLHLARTLFDLGKLDEAEIEYQQCLTRSNDRQARIGLARVFFAKETFSKCIVVLEQLLEEDDTDRDLVLLHVKALLGEGSIQQAMQVYQQILAKEPGFRNEEIDARLRRPAEEPHSAIEDDDRFVQRPDTTFADVGGMEKVKKEIDLKIIKSLKNPELYRAYGKKVGGGILLYGPPGCGKTFLARATAGEVNARFISVGLSDILDMWIGNSEKNLHEVFELARANKPCVLFFDEIDALGANRSDMKHSGGRHVINQLLQELDGLEDRNEGLLILGATNTPWHLDPAFRRPGRFDRIIFVPPPDAAAREIILKLKLKDRPAGDIDHGALAAKTEGYSGADLEAVVDIAVEEKLELALSDGLVKPLQTKDLLNAVKKHRPSTREWFSTAKNHALYANTAGLYDEVLSYLKIQK